VDPDPDTAAAPRSDPSGRIGLTVVLVACGLLVLASAGFKAGCIDAVHNYPRTCYSDVLELFTSRNVSAHVFPYLHGRLVDGAPQDTYEYPVLTGLFIWFSGLLAHDRTQFLLVSTVLLAPCALLVAGLLHRMTGRRALLWAGCPSLVLYSLHNWDLLAVAAATAGLWAWWRDRPVLAGALLAVGGCLKVYPLLFLAPLLAELLVRRRPRRAAEVAAAVVAVLTAVNLPFILANPGGWWTTFDFQRQRAADSSSNSIWFWGHDALTLDTPELNRLLTLLVLLAVAAAVGYGVLRARREAFPFLQVCAACLVAFLLLNKVASPQYTLWLLPFFALLRVRIGWWVAYLAADALVYVGIFRWFTDLGHGQDFGLAKQALVVGVWTKAVIQALLFVVLLRARTAVGQSTQRPEVKVRTNSAISGAEVHT
jgi:uncharacterized membrane protein